MIDDLPPLRDIVARFDLAPKKALGQNFLFDLNLTARIARAAGPLHEATIIEVGPGPGGLTRALLAEGARRVIAIERDARCLAALAEISDRYPGRLFIIEGDALEMSLAELFARAGDHFGDSASNSEPKRVCANLPYNISTALLTRWLETSIWPPVWDRLILMFQREVAERIVATPAERVDYGRLGVLCGWRTKARILFDVPAAAFTPPPKVLSSIVEFIPRQNPLACEQKDLAAVTLAAFGQRRKMLRQSLKSLSAPVDSATLLDMAGIAPTKRAEEIPVEGFVDLARALAQSRQEAK